jgi:hypothetical protein
MRGKSNGTPVAVGCGMSAFDHRPLTMSNIGELTAPRPEPQHDPTDPPPLFIGGSYFIPQIEHKPDDEATPGAIQAALGHYADGVPALDPTLRSDDEAHSGAFARITARARGVRAEYLPKNSETLGDVNTVTGRLAALNRMTQEEQGDPQSLERCGAASLVGGALLAKGTGGLTTLMDAIERGEKDPKKLQDLRDHDLFLRVQLERIAKGDKDAKLTVGDMHALEQNVYEELKEQGGDSEKNSTGLKAATLEGFMEHNEDMRKMFANSGLDLRAITPDKAGKGSGHVVLDIDPNSSKAGVYDPAATLSGQVHSNPQNVQDYKDATAAIIDGHHPELIPKASRGA